MSQYINDANAIAKLSTSATLSISGATATEALSINDTKVIAIQVADTSANISSSLHALKTIQSSGLLTGITLTGSPQPLNLKIAQLTEDVGALALIQNGFKANITDALVADVPSLKTNSNVSSMVVTASPADLINDVKLGYLKSASGKISTIQFASGTDPIPTLSLTASQWTNNQSVFGKFSSNFKVALTGVGASSAPALALDSRVTSLAIGDTATGIVNNLNSLTSLGPKLASISPAMGATLALTMTAGQYDSAGAVFTALGHGSGTYSLNITGATADKAQTLANNIKVTGISVKDSTANIVNHLADLSNNTVLKQIQLTDSSNVMNLSGPQYGSLGVRDTLALITGGYTLNVNNATIDQAIGNVSGVTNLQNNSHVSTFSLTDSASNVGANLNALNNLAKLTGISINHNDAPITLTQAQVTSDTSILNQLQGPFSLNVTGSSIADLSDTLQLPNLNSVAVTDSAVNVSNNFDQLVQMGGTLASLTVSDSSKPIALSETQYQQGTSTLASIQGNYSLAILNASIQDFVSVASDNNVATVSVAATADDIKANLGDLETLATTANTKLDSITITDGKPLALTTSDQTTYQDALSLIQGPFNLVTIPTT